jgi:hypothetical protein
MTDAPPSANGGDTNVALHFVQCGIYRTIGERLVKCCAKSFLKCEWFQFSRDCFSIAVACAVVSGKSV